MKRKKFLIAGCTAGLLLASASSPVLCGDEQTRALGLVNERCTTCHTLSRVRQHIGKNDLAAWERYVTGMQQKGARIDDQEREIISQFLASLQSGTDL